MNKQDHAKIAAGKAAIDQFVKEGMKIGLGSGSTSHLFIRSLAEKIRAGLNITATASSKGTSEFAEKMGIKITDIDDIGMIDLTIDGLDEIDPQFRMIKGGGACLLWEKIVAQASRRMIVICDETKLTERLGNFPLPLEIIQFGVRQTERQIACTLTHFGIDDGKIALRRDRDGLLITDNGNFILDCHCRQINDPEGLEQALNMIPGVVENGLFNREADGMIIGKFDGSTETHLRENALLKDPAGCIPNGR